MGQLRSIGRLLGFGPLLVPLRASFEGPHSPDSGHYSAEPEGVVPGRPADWVEALEAAGVRRHR